jgi:aminoglycoside/choline kinase family phosphotransferase
MGPVTEPFIKRREPAARGSIPDVLAMFVNEVLFYREVAPVIGVRVPACLTAQEDNGSTLLELENLADWTEGADPVQAARLLAAMHTRWAELFDATWPDVTGRPELSPAARAFGERLVGRVPAVERRAARAGPETLVHGDASARNMRTSPTGELALLDWEDVGRGPGMADLAWLLVSSVDPAEWDTTIDAYGGSAGLRDGLPSATVQAFLSFAAEPRGSEQALSWVVRIEAAARRLA